MLPKERQFSGMTPWNEENIRVLKQLWEAGETASDIAQEFVSKGYSSITRNAVIGKAHRMSFKQPPRGNSPKVPREQPRKRIIVPPTDPRAKIWAKKKTQLPTKIETKLLDPNNPGISIMELQSDSCRAIVRDGTPSSLATYCGEKTEGSGSYCAGHAAIYYQPPLPRVRR